MTSKSSSKPNDSRMIARVRKLLADTPVVDVHTHTFDPAMGSLLLWGIDELLTYHYLIAEIFRARPELEYDGFFAMPTPSQADLIWDELFVKRSPVSEACRGVLTVLRHLGLNVRAPDLTEAREFFRSQSVYGYVDKVFKLAGIREVTMTNDPLDPVETVCWQKGFERDSRFHAALRLDSALMNWPAGVPALQKLGYDVTNRLDNATFGEIRRFLKTWIKTMQARYMAVSLPPCFRYPAPSSESITVLMQETVLPVAREAGLPLAMMIGVKKLTNPQLRLAGDSVGKGDIDTLDNLARDYPDVRFAITMLSRENMHELCVTARKFKNITPFGCWWFLNNPSLIREITAMRLETLGLSFIPQHSDARVLDQLIYKWDHSRRIIGEVLAEKYADLPYAVEDSEILRDLEQLFGTNIK